MCVCAPRGPHAMANAEQEEELEALAAIFGAGLEAVDTAARAYRLRLEAGHIEYCLTFVLPDGYPLSQPPIYELDPRFLGVAGPIAAQLDAAFEAGEPVLFSWADWLCEFLEGCDALQAAALAEPEDLRFQPSASAAASGESRPGRDSDGGGDSTASALADRLQTAASLDSAADSGSGGDFLTSGPVTICAGEPLTDRKSTFQGFAAYVQSVAEADAMVRTLKRNGKIARATHNMVAYRIRTPAGAQLQDNDEDGEHGAGARMLHLLQVVDVQNVCVMVTRWYGGVHLGPDRFKHISNAARQAMTALGAIQPAGAKASKKKGKRGKTH